MAGILLEHMKPTKQDREIRETVALSQQIEVADVRIHTGWEFD